MFKKLLNKLTSLLKKSRIINGILVYLSNPDIRKRLFFTVGVIVLYRFLASIPPAGIDVTNFTSIFKDNPLTSMFTLATGGSLDNPSLVMMGLGAYINASIVIQLLSTVIPKLEQLSKEGQRGKMVMSQYTRILTVPLSILQGIVIYILLSRTSNGLVSTEVDLGVVTFILSVSAGSLFLMWIGEMLTEKGIGNGTSLLISFSILSSLPGLIQTDIQGLTPLFTSFAQGSISLLQLLTSPMMLLLYAVIIGFIILVVLIVYVNEGTRKIAIQYARRTIGRKDNYLPIKVTQAGVLPIIFASSIITFPGIIAQLLANSFAEGTVGFKIVTFILNSPLNQFNSWQYLVLYFVMIIAFTYFYTFVISKPQDTADNLKKSGGFIPGIRPGQQTNSYLIEVMIRLTAIGSVFLAFLAISPSIAKILVGGSGESIGILSGIGGTSILIMVSVLLTTYRKLESMKVTKSYDQYR
jgi:preprotein translocase subunit SecY